MKGSIGAIGATGATGAMGATGCASAACGAAGASGAIGMADVGLVCKGILIVGVVVGRSSDSKERGGVAWTR